MESRKIAMMHIKKQLQLMSKSEYSFSVGLENSDLFQWRVCMEGPHDTLYEGGLFQALLNFPDDYPNNPPSMVFTTEMWHPNIYKDGKVCISILHPPEEDLFNPQEKVSEKWRPVLSIEDVLLSVQSMILDPNLESPANVDAAIQLKNDPDGFKKKVRQLVRASVEG